MKIILRHSVFINSLKRTMLLAMTCLVSGLVSGQATAVDSAANRGQMKSMKLLVTNLENGSPVDSAEVSLGGLKKGYTDRNGVFEAENVFYNTLVAIRARGFADQSKKALPNVKFRLIRESKLNQVSLGKISTGLYSRPEEHYAGAAVTYSGERLRQFNNISILEALSIADPAFTAVRSNLDGDDPNALASVTLRGNRQFPAKAAIATDLSGAANAAQLNPSAGDFVAAQIASPNQPMILLDGMQISLRQLADLDIYRIESITLLKDAAATAMYGARAGNGVVLVKTTLPQKGSLNLTYSGQLQVATPQLNSYNLMEAADKLELEKTAGMYTNNDALYQQRLRAVQSGVNTDWLKEPTQTGVGSRHNLFLQGGDDAFQYGVDFGYNQLKGAMKGSERRNMNLGAYVAAQVRSLFVSNYLTYVQTTGINSAYGSLQDYAWLNPYWSNTDSVTGGTPRILEEYKLGDSIYKTYNPAYNATLATTNKTQYNRISNLTRFQWMIGKGFDLTGNLAFNSNKDVSDIFLPPGHTAFVQYKPEQFFKRGLYSQTSANFRSLEGSLQLHYTRVINHHSFYGSTGVLAQSTQSEATGISVQGFTSDQIANISFGSAYTTSKPATGKINTSLLSGFLNLAYSYANRYQLDVVLTRDGSSQFGPDNRYANYWSTALSWNVHNEAFLSGISWINQLKLRASYGTAGSIFYKTYAGNTSYNYYTSQQYIPGSATTDTRGVGLGAFLTGYGNTELQSPTVAKQNLGIDVSLFDNRLQLRFEQFSEKADKLVLPYLSPSYTGFSNIYYYDNLGAIENKGMGGSLRYVIIRNTNKNIQWSIGANGLHAQNTITQTDGGYLDKLNNYYNSSLVDQTRPQPMYVKGQSLSTIWAVPSLGIDPQTGKELFRKADGSTTSTWDAADKIAVGDMMPNWQGSFGTNLVWKQASFGAWFYYQTGGQVYNQTLADKVENANLEWNVDARAANDRWQRPGDQASFKPLSLNGRASDPTYATTRFVEDQNFLDAASISLRYTWPRFAKLKLPLKQTSVGFTANHSFRKSSVSYERGINYPLASFYSFTFSTSIN